MKGYIFIWIALLLATTLTSCEKEELTQQKDDDTILYPDEEPVEVPEGYFLARFFGEETANTRAAESTAGTHNRITHLQYIIYKLDDDNATYKVYKKSTVFDNSGSTATTTTWPYTGRSIGEVLPKGSYRVVFLGNMTPGLFKSLKGAMQTEPILTNVAIGDNYTQARIHLPKGEFEEYSYFYMDKADFVSGESTTSTDVPILLERIVSRNDLRKESLEDNTFSSSDVASYNKAYMRQLSSKYLLSQLRKQGGALHRDLTAEMDKVIMGLVYVGTKDVTAVTIDDYLSTWPILKYKRGGADNTLDATTKGYLDGVVTTGKEHIGSLLTPKYADYAYTTASDNFKNNILVNLGQYLYDLFHAGIDEDVKTNPDAATKLPEILANNGGIHENTFTYSAPTDGMIITKNDVEGTSVDGAVLDQLSGLLDNNLRHDLVDNYNNYLLAWKRWNFSPATSYKLAYLKVDKMPESFDFDFGNVEYLKNTDGSQTDIKLCYKFRESPEKWKDNYISIVGLGDGQPITVKGIGIHNSGDNDVSWIINNQHVSSYIEDGTVSIGNRETNRFYETTQSVSTLSITDQTQKSGSTISTEIKIKTILENILGITEEQTNNAVLVYNKTYKLTIGSNTDISTYPYSQLCASQPQTTKKDLLNLIEQIVSHTTGGSNSAQYSYNYSSDKIRLTITLPAMANNITFERSWSAPTAK